jgi:hypothetical protein
MSDRSSKLWVLGPPVLIVLTVFVYYAKYHWARTWIDERSPWIKEHIGSRLPALVIGEPSASDSSVESGTFGAGPEKARHPRGARDYRGGNSNPIDVIVLARKPIVPFARRPS